MAKLNIGKIWDAVDGNKTKIGAAIVAAGELVSLKPEYTEIGKQISVVGSFVAGGGLAHGFWKLIRKFLVK